MKKNHINRSPKLYLNEIVEFIGIIQNYTKGIAYDDFVKDARTIDAVDANIRNKGEAVRVLAKHRNIKELFNRFHIPYTSLADMRTDLTHEYFSRNVDAIWKTTQTLVSLKPQFLKVLQEVS